MRWYLFPLFLIAAVALTLAAACGRADDPDAGGAVDMSRDDAAVSPGKPPAGDSAAGRTAQSEGAGAPAEGGAGSLPPNLLDRKISYQASLDLAVDDVIERLREVERIATDTGGHVAQSSSHVDGDRRVASVTIRVPADRYQEAMDRLRGVAEEVKDERVSSQDVTEEYTDLQARLRNLEATEQQYLSLLAQADEIGEVLQVQDRLMGVRGEIEVVKGRIQLLDQLTQLATIDVSLAPAEPVAGDGGAGAWEPAESVERAWEASLAVLGFVAGSLIMAAVFSWWLVPLILLGAWLGRRWWRRRARVQETPGAAGA